LELRRTELVQVATGKLFGTFYEVLARDEFTPQDVERVPETGACAWHFRRSHLFVSTEVAQRIQQQGFYDLTFSPAFSGFAGASA
jgi:hypothetical protein